MIPQNPPKKWRIIMTSRDIPALAQSLSKERGCPVKLAQGCRNPGVPHQRHPPRIPWLRCKVLADLQRSLSIALHARYDSQHSDTLTPEEWVANPLLLTGPFKQHASLVDSAAEHEHIGEYTSAAEDLPASGVRRQGR